jgi:RNA-directed DNA polymerase
MAEPTYAQVHTWDNLWQAWRQAAKGKRGRPPAASFEYRLADNLLALQAELRDKAYTPGPYASFFIHEPKRRLISAAPFRDRVVHHALCNVVESLFERSFIYDSYANRTGKGTHRALDRCQHFARRYRYVLQCDVRQFFPSIDHAILRETLARKLHDPDLLWLVDRILASGAGVLSEQYEMVYFPQDDPSTLRSTQGSAGSGQGLLAALRPRGLPIGNLTSQFWANCYLNPFDHFVKRELRCPAYLRYVDDFLLFGDSRAQLWEWKRAIIRRLARLRLTIHERRAQASARGSARGVRPVSEGIPFLGFVVYAERRRLKRRKGVAFGRRLRELAQAYADGQVTLEQVNASVRGWVEHVRYGNTVGLRASLLGSVRLSAPRRL